MVFHCGRSCIIASDVGILMRPWRSLKCHRAFAISLLCVDEIHPVMIVHCIRTSFP